MDKQPLSLEDFMHALTIRAGLDDRFASYLYTLTCADDALEAQEASAVQDTNKLIVDELGYPYSFEEIQEQVIDFTEDKILPMSFRSGVKTAEILKAALTSIYRYYEKENERGVSYNGNIINYLFQHLSHVLPYLPQERQEEFYQAFVDPFLAEYRTENWYEDVFYWLVQCFDWHTFGERLIPLIQENLNPEREIFSDMVVLMLDIAYVVSKPLFQELYKKYSYLDMVKEFYAKILIDEKAPELEDYLKKSYSEAVFNQSYNAGFFGDQLLSLYREKNSPDYLPFLKRLIDDEKGGNSSHVEELQNNLPESEWEQWREKILKLPNLNKLFFYHQQGMSNQAYSALSLASKIQLADYLLCFSDIVKVNPDKGDSFICNAIIESAHDGTFDFDCAFDLLEKCAKSFPNGAKTVLMTIEGVKASPARFSKEEEGDLLSLEVALKEKKSN